MWMHTSYVAAEDELITGSLTYVRLFSQVEETPHLPISNQDTRWWGAAMASANDRWVENGIIVFDSWFWILVAESVPQRAHLLQLWRFSLYEGSPDADILLGYGSEVVAFTCADSAAKWSMVNIW